MHKQDRPLSQQQLQQLQKQHQDQIIKTFLSYSQLMTMTSPYTQLTHSSKRTSSIHYYHLIQKSKLQQYHHAIKSNQLFLNSIIQFCQGQQRINKVKSNQNIQVNYANFSKIKTTVKQFYREWSTQGKQKNDYMKIVQKAKKYLQKGDKVLAPGSGLGRLVLEFVQAGFGCQGNQISYFMLYGSNFILNCIQSQRSYTIYPFISSTDYYYNQQSLFRSISIPDKAACQVVSQDSDFSMSAGPFIDVYSTLRQQFHCVITCFFLDTANNIFQYINTIYHTLKLNGIWINYGPLLFHYREMYNQISIQISWEMLREYVNEKFQILEEEFDETNYCHDEQSGMGVKYKCIMFVAKKK